MSNNPIVESLKIVLANSFAMYVKLQNYHWNVEGENFMELHEFFESLYKDFATANDDIAERIRTYDIKVPASLSFYESNKTIEDGDENSSSTEMLKNLAYDYEQMGKCCYDAFNVAEKHSDQATMDLLIERIRTQEKHLWMLRSYIG